ncbi:MAG: Cytosolic Fe-S cluster assembly factor nar1 [Vezdaea aestivalis]|nr:MAG: Cytosolic Fe-S cluster assembly factor nar1 [Vezdaea aestivalis]
MSAILSADDLNDFIGPGVACIKPIEAVPLKPPNAEENPYEVTKEDKLGSSQVVQAQISLTDCLACSGCVTSAEAVLISLQSHSEVLSVLDQYDSPSDDYFESTLRNCPSSLPPNTKIFVASVCSQTRASLAAAVNTSTEKTSLLIDALLRGPSGLRSGGRRRSGFTWVVDTDNARQACQVLGEREVELSVDSSFDLSAKGNIDAAKLPILTSACPGWICYAEKTHPYVLPHLSRVKSPQALVGTLLKTSLARALNIDPDQVWHLAIMPCFDKKLEASRQELTDTIWRSNANPTAPTRDVDCVITTKELLMLAESRNFDFKALAARPLDLALKRPPFPEPKFDNFLFPPRFINQQSTVSTRSAGTSGGYLHHILQSHLLKHPGSFIQTERGRNADVIEYTLVQGEKTILRAARYYGFRNIQNLVRKLKPVKQSRIPGAKAASLKRAGGVSIYDYAYVEVMACPGGCTNGGGQIRPSDLLPEIGETRSTFDPILIDQKEWLHRVDEAYYSGTSEDEGEHSTVREHDAKGSGNLDVSSFSRSILFFLEHWAAYTNIDHEKLVYTSFREVESDVGKSLASSTERVVALSSKAGGGW